MREVNKSTRQPANIPEQEGAAKKQSTIKKVLVAVFVISVLILIVAIMAVWYRYTGRINDLLGV